MLKQILYFTFAVVACYAEVPRSGPYPSSGWQPKGAPFELPKNFLPQHVQEVEVSKENVQHTGSSVEVVSRNVQPNFGYLPPSSDDIPDDVSTEDNLKVQGLPNQSKQLNFKEYTPQQNTNNYPHQNNQQLGQLKQRQFPNSRQLQFQRQTSVSQEYSPPNFYYNAPQQEYGVPASDNGNVEIFPESYNQEAERTQVNNYPNPGQGSTVTAASELSSGQYYVLTPDNTLQKVIFMTSQNPVEARSNAFTAQLKYIPVEPIRDPIYAYNEQGQFVRIYKK